MNRSLFISRHLYVAGAIVIVLVILGELSGVAYGWDPGMSRPFTLGSGWVTLLLMLVVMAYVGRKYAHQLRYSPEFKMKVELAQLEAAEAGINALRQRIAQGGFSDKKSIQQAAQAILANEKVHKVNKVLVEESADGAQGWTVQVVPTEPLVRKNRWMHAHLYYGLAFGLTLVMHSGLQPSSGFGLGLGSLGVWVLLTGLVGIVLWALGPTWLTRREKDLSIEEAYAISTTLGRKRAESIAGLPESLQALFQRLAGQRTLSQQDTAAALQQASRIDAEGLTEFSDLLALLTQEKLVREEYNQLWRVRASYMWWRYLHIPAAILLAMMVAVHIWTVWKY